MSRFRYSFQSACTASMCACQEKGAGNRSLLGRCVGCPRRNGKILEQKMMGEGAPGIFLKVAPSEAASLFPGMGRRNGTC